MDQALATGTIQELYSLGAVISIPGSLDLLERSELRSALKKVKGTGNADDRAQAVKLLDRSGRKRLIHPNTAARMKSKLAKAANKK